MEKHTQEKSRENNKESKNCFYFPQRGSKMNSIDGIKY